ncbi:MAG: UDP-N-acetylmuramate--L-alanine ligase [Paludibacteraceae bacterium]|nr:UDP-N-acetylmuramate--L-alanine ligase [Paludibacteraceae bacterium]
MQSFYFLGIGGIGMSALARYFKHLGYDVRGYDRTPSPLTRELEAEQISIIYDVQCTIHNAQWNLEKMSPENTLVVRTPAVPEDQDIYTYLREQGYTILKRSEMLGMVTRQKKALCVAGTHGKTTTSTMLAYILSESHLGTNAFLGGISNNFQSNLLIDENSDFVVVEADEYDRSFHHLQPYMSVITSIDPDHLDIYGTAEEYQKGFDVYAGLVEHTVLLKAGYHVQTTANLMTYCGAKSDEQADFYADNVEVNDGDIYFDFVGPNVRIKHVRLGVPVWVNIENSVAAMAMAWLNGATEEEIRRGVERFAGVYRRFNIHVKTDKVVYVDDYAHHPTELNASIQSIRKLYKNRHFIVIFQPHLYTRTRDFAADFKRVLSQADELVLLPIYPARELPIEGVTSEMLLTVGASAHSDIGTMRGVVVEKKDLITYIRERVRVTEGPVVVLSLGAGDIDRLVPALTEALQ